MIDLHCHILPGIDDGPATVPEALDMARAALANGITVVVATPHVSWDYEGVTPFTITDGVRLLRATLAQAKLALEILPGAELAMSHAADKSDRDLVGLRLNGARGKYLLVECPAIASIVGMEPLIERLRSRGHEVILAHPERCPGFQRDPAAYERCIAKGALGQLTAASLSGRFGRPAQDFADSALRSGLAHIVASDGHSPVDRPPSIRAELAAAGYEAQTEWLAREVPHAVLSGTPVPPAPPMPARRGGGLRRFLGR